MQYTIMYFHPLLNGKYNKWINHTVTSCHTLYDTVLRQLGVNRLPNFSYFHQFPVSRQKYRSSLSWVRVFSIQSTTIKATSHLLAVISVFHKIVHGPGEAIPWILFNSAQWIFDTIWIFQIKLLRPKEGNERVEEVSWNATPSNVSPSDTLTVEVFCADIQATDVLSVMCSVC